jgi:hypothetical protein
MYYIVYEKGNYQYVMHTYTLWALGQMLFNSAKEVNDNRNAVCTYTVISHGNGNSCSPVPCAVGKWINETFQKSRTSLNDLTETTWINFHAIELLHCKNCPYWWVSSNVFEIVSFVWGPQTYRRLCCTRVRKWFEIAHN